MTAAVSGVAWPAQTSAYVVLVTTVPIETMTIRSHLDHVHELRRPVQMLRW